MNTQDERSEIIKQFVPKLIKRLTKFKDGGENFLRCENFASLTIRNHKNLSTNSHHVKRKMGGIREKFVSENCISFSEHFGQLCEDIIRDPLCVNHYEVDVNWSFLDFLLTLAYNPSAVLRRQKNTIVLFRTPGDNTEENPKPDSTYWKNLLKDDFIYVHKNDDTDLSDWSEDSGVVGRYDFEDIECEWNPFLQVLPIVKNPQNSTPYILSTNVIPELELTYRQQHTDSQNILSNSQQPEANSARILIKYFNNVNVFNKIQEPDTLSEYCLLRELVWMFKVSTTCVFFYADNNGIHLRDNITITSATVNSLRSFFDEHILPYLEMARVLRSFLSEFFKCDSSASPPKTLESYAASTRSLLQPFWRAILAYEERLILHEDLDIHSVIHFRKEMSKPFQLLASLYHLHQQVILRQNITPPHIRSTFLLASLLHHQELAVCPLDANLIMSHFLMAVKVFCNIIDTWWTDGRLDDWKQEFIVERVNQSSQIVRQFTKNKDQSFFVPVHVSNVINGNKFFHIIYEYSSEAGSTLNLLYEINRIVDMRNICADNVPRKLYDDMIQEFMEYIRKMDTEVQRSNNLSPNKEMLKYDAPFVNTSSTEGGQYANNKNCQKVRKKIGHERDRQQELQNCLSTKDAFLIHALSSACNFNVPDNFSKDMKNGHLNYDLNAIQIFEILNQNGGQVLLPMQELLLSTMTRLLNERISLANSFVMSLYHGEYKILQHLQHLRWVYLLEASDLMHEFYEKLFKEIELGCSWANPFALTSQLDDILTSNFTEMSSRFRVAIKSLHRCHTTHICEAVEELVITYNFSPELAHVVNQLDVEQYNNVFRFLLKIKWGLHALEQLHFSKACKRRPAYAPIKYTDLLMRRFHQLRFWMLVAIQNIHFHLMTHVLQVMGEQLDEKLSQCTNFKQMKNLHSAYLRTVSEHCFLTSNFKHIKRGIEHFLSLVHVMRLEWNYCIKHIDSSNPMTQHTRDNIENLLENDIIENFVSSTQIEEMECSYINCHQYLANELNKEIYINQNTFLTGLSAAFNSSLPH